MHQVGLVLLYRCKMEDFQVGMFSADLDKRVVCASVVFVTVV
jgi:hypothetical protein